MWAYARTPTSDPPEQKEGHGASLDKSRIMLVGFGLLVLSGIAGASTYYVASPRAQTQQSGARGGFEDFVDASLARTNRSLAIFKPKIKSRTLIDEVNMDGLLISQCVVDTTQTVALLGMAIEFIWQASESMTLKCPDQTTAGCGIAVTVVIQCFAWIASSLSSAASSCAKTLSAPELCAADITGIIAALTSIATSAQSVGTACNPKMFEKPTIPPKHLEAFLNAVNSAAINLRDSRTHDLVSRNIDKLGPGLLAAVDQSKIEKVKSQIAKEQGWAKAQCSFDVLLTVDMLMQAAIFITSATVDCEDPQSCAADATGIVGVFAWAANSLSMAASDCHIDGGNVQALCAGDIEAFVANVNLLASFGMQVGTVCDPDAQAESEETLEAEIPDATPV